MRKTIQTFNNLTDEALPSAGGKGSSLAKLYQAGFPVPDGFVIFPNAFKEEDLHSDAWSEVQRHVNRFRKENPEVAFAVRSSAMSEDSTQASFAGEFESVLNVQTDEDIYQAIITVYKSRKNERVQAYSLAKGMGTLHDIAVIVQELVTSESSGVLFTANPITGKRDQAMISAAWGLGEAIVGGLVTPDTLIVEKSSGEFVSKEIAIKKVMTVRMGSHTEEVPVPEDRQITPVLTNQEAATLTEIGNQIEAFYGKPMDIEWTLADGKISIVQARPITALPVPEPAPPAVWELPSKGRAMRNNIVELMADPLSPLFKTLGLKAVNTSMTRIMTGFFGNADLLPDEPIVVVNEYAYYNSDLSGKQILQILLGSVSIIKRMFSGAVERWTETGRPHYKATVENWKNQDWQSFPSTKLIEAARELTEAAIDGYGALVSGVIPAAWISEGIFMFVHKLFKRRDDPPAPIYLMGYDSLPIRAEKALYDLSEWILQHEKLSAYIRDTPSKILAELLLTGETPPDVALAGWEELQTRFQAHLENYGHTIYDLDFANPVPADDPSPILETLKLFITGGGTNPHERQRAAAERREQAVQAKNASLKGLRLKIFQKNLARAQKYAPLREDGLADVGLSYPLVRQMLHELGRRFVDAGLIDMANEVYWLTQEEIEKAATQLDNGKKLTNLAYLVPERKAIWRAAKKATPPLSLPEIKIFGKDLGKMKADRAVKQEGDTLKGVAASPGSITGAARVLHGPEDFDQMITGDILVAPLTTPAWTPLFARAAAIVTDVGGPLSHGSIVAREYGIPAVLGTGSATKLITNGQIIRVDGSAGNVLLTSK
jgi:pyruvate,water dikinase